MRAAAVFLLFACVQGAHAQALVFNTASYAPPTFPTCGIDPFSVTQTITQPWTVYSCTNIGVNSGNLQATGTGWCAGEGQYCDAANKPAPWFQAMQSQTSSGGWLIYINVSSVPSGGAVLGGYFCANAKITQSPTPPYPVGPPGCTKTCTPSAETSGPSPLNKCISPIVIDTAGQGFHLTSAANGVLFREADGGPQIRISWTDPAYQNGWLALPRNGEVLSLADLFGNFSPQPSSADPNGYRALAYFAAQQGCGTAEQPVDAISSTSCPAAWNQLRIWVDANHNGISEPAELHTLGEMGIARISLLYRGSHRVDQYGNEFRYVSDIVDREGPKANRCYDVFLVRK